MIVMQQPRGRAASDGPAAGIGSWAFPAASGCCAPDWILRTPRSVPPASWSSHPERLFLEGAEEAFHAPIAARFPNKSVRSPSAVRQMDCGLPRSFADLPSRSREGPSAGAAFRRLQSREW